MLQTKALNILKSGKNVFLTGSAGTGKTYVLNQYIEYLKKHKVPVAVTASTGIAATHMKGTTIHAWSGIGIKNSITKSDIKNLMTKKYLVNAIEKTDVLIIDEISMLHRNQLDMVNEILKAIKQEITPFGGMQVVFAGDFFQLPPVSRTNETNREKFAFMSKSWVEAAPVVCYLTEQFRQSQNSLNQVLEEIRTGSISHHSIHLLEGTKNNTTNIEPTKLYTHNIDVDQINSQELSKISATTKSFKGEKKGNPKLMEVFVKSLIVPERLVLKKGAKVMFLKNNHEKGVMNGSLGIIHDFDAEEGFPIVKLSDKRMITARPESWSIVNEKGSNIVEFKQVPLRLAWAITVHKSQGMTLECAEVDLSKTFEPGQGYVALSRLRDLEGLKLLGFNELALQVDSLASKADARFRELSREAEITLDNAGLESQFKSHIIRRGGTVDKAEIAKNEFKKKAKEEKISTYVITEDLVKEGKNIEEIMETRGLAESTIIGHILKIHEKNPEINLSFCKPNSEVIKEIFSAYKNVKAKANEDDFTEDGKLKLQKVYGQLQKKYDYNSIKLALIFAEKNSK
jgi:ATP-dependent exoDNAse (exonuclease V) alpha subunit